MAHYSSLSPSHEDRSLRALRRLVLVIAALLVATACANDPAGTPAAAPPAASNPATLHGPLLTR